MEIFKKENFFKPLIKIDWFLILIVLCLCIIGIGSLYSASGGSWKPWSLNHLYRCCLGFTILIVISLTNPRYFLKYSILLYFFCLFGLFYVEFFGVGNVKRWIDFKFFFIQPSEITKIGIILFLANYFYSFANKLNNLFYYIIPFLAILLPSLLVIGQPDLGTGFMIFVLGMCLIFIVGLPWKMVFFILFSSLASIPILWQQLYEYQKQRILIFLNPDMDSLGTGYQIIQSKIAIGSGGLLGKGYLLGSQSRLEYLPEKHTDFVFTLIAEEMGFIGTIFVILLFCLLISLILKNFFSEDNLGYKIIIFGISFLFFLYVSLNIGMVSGLIPVVGAPLPFISHGGTSLLTAFTGLGIIQSIRIHKKNY